MTDLIEEIQNLITTFFSTIDNLLKSVPYEYFLIFIVTFPVLMLALALYFFEKKRRLENEVSVLRKKFETYNLIFSRKCEEVLREKRNELEDLIHEEIIPESIEIFMKTNFFKSIASGFDESKIDREKIKTELKENVEYMELVRDIDKLLEEFKETTVEEIKKA
ncbi:MAG: hypothetical protein QW412_02350 [Candidatus Aenigmatarchaeota archaeon]